MAIIGPWLKRVADRRRAAVAGRSHYRAAMAAWKKAGKRPVVETTARGMRVVLSRRLAIVRHTDGDIARIPSKTSAGTGISTDIVAYPRPELVRTFKAANAQTPKGAPGRRFPGSVGSVSLTIRGVTAGYLKNAVEEATGKEAPRNWMEMGYAQFHYQVGEQISRSMHAAHAGWRYRALRESLGVARALGMPLMLHSINSRPATLDDFKKACEKEGATLLKTGGAYVALFLPEAD